MTMNCSICVIILVICCLNLATTYDLTDCISNCIGHIPRKYIWCKIKCYKDFSFGGYMLKTKDECYATCDTLPTVNRVDCKMACDFLFKDSVEKSLKDGESASDPINID
ncbi:PREDICTED: uncharacterized protein LOC105364692 [Ceratosolen solmsi marchali]|uniref:Uncharacterized protein LOC105364692 n=1 Tax=Ceratosolen solmsi marchali TaxID=326594 RepID=A0AAJ6YMU4_9HYME|nr:PREDICTED: uncharacterized protein LOC105364692 [Ceratosolen solmsi marchali]